MSIEDDDSGPSLKELLTKSLEVNGTLGNIQAQLRASIFLTLEEEFKEKNIPLVNEKTKLLLDSPVGKMAVAIVQDFLRCLNLEFSLTVFNPEANVSSSQQNYDRNSLLKLIPNNTIKDDNIPALFSLIESINKTQSSFKVNNGDTTNNNSKESTHNLNAESQPVENIDLAAATLKHKDSETRLHNTTEMQTITSTKLSKVDEKKEPTSNAPNEITKSSDLEDEYSEDFSSEDHEDESKKSKSNTITSNVEKKSDSPEETDADDISEDIPIEINTSLLDSDSEKSTETIDVTASESKPVADYEESL